MLEPSRLVLRLGTSRGGECSDGALGVWLWVDARLRVVHSTHEVACFIGDISIGLF